ncbi:MAG: hypothetical protein ACD_79C01077G0004 [uncultured bacterium]|nr:MAG: hypothetical protein ACD_79C01077G0004 [uncultured bacterium]
MAKKMTLEEIRKELLSLGTPYLNIYTLCKLLFKKGIITEEEYISEMEDSLKFVTAELKNKKEINSKIQKKI